MINFLTQLKFQLKIDKLPNVTFFTQAASLPSISLQSLEVNTQKNKIYEASTVLEYGELSITFKVDEEMRNYQEIYDWMVGISGPENYTTYKSYTETREKFSDASLMVINSANRPTLEIKYKNIFPISLGELNFDMRSQDVEYLDCTANFRYDTFSISRINR